MVFRREFSKSETFTEIVARLATAATSATSNLVKLLKGLETGTPMQLETTSPQVPTFEGIGNMVLFAHKDVLQDISTISSVAGELAVATQVCFSSQP